MKNSDKIPATLSMVFDTSEPKKTRTKTSKQKLSSLKSMILFMKQTI